MPLAIFSGANRKKAPRGAGPGTSPIIGPELLEEHEHRHGAIEADAVVLSQLARLEAAAPLADADRAEVSARQRAANDVAGW